MRIIGFNGPPRSGKDTLANHVALIHSDEYRFLTDKEGYPTAKYDNSVGAPYSWGSPRAIESRACIMPIRYVAFRLLGKEYSFDEYERIKDMPQKTFNGETVRQFMIGLMEDHIKPRYGKDFAVRTVMADVVDSVRVYDNELLWLITDIGFQEEVDFLESLVGYENFMLCLLERDGTNFGGDSRSYVSASQMMYHKNQINPEDGAKAIMRYAYHAYGWEF